MQILYEPYKDSLCQNMAHIYLKAGLIIFHHHSLSCSKNVFYKQSIHKIRNQCVENNTWQT